MNGRFFKLYCYLLLSFLLVFPFKAIANDNSFYQMDKELFTQMLIDDYKKAVDNTALYKNFLEKYNLNKIPDHSINFVARLNTYASEGLLRLGKPINTKDYYNNLKFFYNTGNFNEIDLMRFYFLSELNYLPQNNTQIQTYKNTKIAKLLNCFIQQKICEKLNFSTLIDKRIALLHSLSPFLAIDTKMAKKIWDIIIKNTIQNSNLDNLNRVYLLDLIHYDVNKFFKNIVSINLLNSNLISDQNFLFEIVHSEKALGRFYSIFSEMYLDDMLKIAKKHDFNDNFEYFDNPVNVFIKTNFKQLNYPHVHKYLLQIYHLDPDFFNKPKKWYEIAKQIEINARNLSKEGSDYHLKTLDLLIKTSSQFDAQITNNYIEYALKLSNENKLINFSGNSIVEDYLTKNKKYKKLINLRLLNIKKNKNDLKKFKEYSNSREFKKISKALIYGTCSDALKISQIYVNLKDIKNAFKSIETLCYEEISQLKYMIDSNSLVDFYFQRNFTGYLLSKLNKINFQNDDVLKKFLITEDLNLSSKFKVFILDAFLNELNFKQNEIYQLIINEIQDIEIDKNNKFLDKVRINNLLFILNNLWVTQNPYQIAKDLNLSIEELHKIQTKIIHIKSQSLLNNAKSNAFEIRDIENFNKNRYELTLKFISTLTKEKINPKNKVGLFTSTLLYQYVFERNIKNPKNSNLLRLMLLKKFSNSESFILFNSILKKQKSKKFKKYFERRKKLIHLSKISNKELDRDYNEVFNYLDNAIISDDTYYKNYNYFLENIFDFNKPIINQIQINLSQDQIYLNYLVLRDVDKILLYSISKKDVKIYLINDFKKIKKDITDYKLAIRGETHNYNLKDAYKIKELLFPSDLLTTDIREIRLSLDDILFDLPFTALPLNKVDNILGSPLYASTRGISTKKTKIGKPFQNKKILWIDDKYKIVYVPSILKFKKDKTRIELNSFLGIGNPDFKNINKSIKQTLNTLPNTEIELNEISKFFNVSNVNLLTGKKASEENFQKQIHSKYNLIAFATHGFMDTEISPVSEPGLALGLNNFGNKKFDGFLSASEIIGLDLKADLVLLNACNTFNTINATKNPFSGLPSSFLGGGAKNVISTLWEVETLSAKMFSNFLVKNLKNNGDIPLSISKSRKMIRNEKPKLWDHPFYWAPFIHAEGTIN